MCVRAMTFAGDDIFSGFFSEDSIELRELFPIIFYILHLGSKG